MLARFIELASFVFETQCKRNKRKPITWSYWSTGRTTTKITVQHRCTRLKAPMLHNQLSQFLHLVFFHLYSLRVQVFSWRGKASSLRPSPSYKHRCEQSLVYVDVERNIYVIYGLRHARRRTGFGYTTEGRLQDRLPGKNIPLSRFTIIAVYSACIHNVAPHLKVCDAPYNGKCRIQSLYWMLSTKIQRAAWPNSVSYTCFWSLKQSVSVDFEFSSCNASCPNDNDILPSVIISKTGLSFPKKKKLEC